MSSGDDRIVIHVKTVDSVFSLTVSPFMSVGNLRQMIIAQRHINKNKNVRLIFQGKLLQDMQASLASIGAYNDCYFHCAVSDYVSREEVQSIPEPPVLRGFDVLRESGFSPAEIEQFRMQFRATTGRTHAQSLLREEEEWINSNVNPAHVSSEDEITEEHPDGGYNDLLLGMIMGFLLGLITLFWLYESALPRWTKYGIIAGIGCNVSFGIIRISQTQ